MIFMNFKNICIQQKTFPSASLKGKRRRIAPASKTLFITVAWRVACCWFPEIWVNLSTFATWDTSGSSGLFPKYTLTSVSYQSLFKSVCVLIERWLISLCNRVVYILSMIWCFETQFFLHITDFELFNGLVNFLQRYSEVDFETVYVCLDSVLIKNVFILWFISIMKLNLMGSEIIN